MRAILIGVTWYVDCFDINMHDGIGMTWHVDCFDLNMHDGVFLNAASVCVVMPSPNSESRPRRHCKGKGTCKKPC